MKPMYISFEALAGMVACKEVTETKKRELLDEQIAVRRREADELAKFKAERFPEPVASQGDMTDSMKGKPLKPGDVARTIPNLCPKWEANRLVKVISWEDFKAGELATMSRYNWNMDEIRRAVFVRFLDGKKPGKVGMMSRHVLYLAAST